MNRLELPEQAKILVVALRRIGDVFLTTALIRSLRQAWPKATIDALVFSETAGILDGNPDLDRIIGFPSRPRPLQSVSLIARLFKRYALAISTQPGDRPIFLALTAGRICVGPVENRFTGRMKRLFLHRSVRWNGDAHRVEQMLAIADAVGIHRAPTLICPQGPVREDVWPKQPYAVIHPTPMFRYKEWSAQNWRGLASAFKARGLYVVITGGPDASERRYIDEIWPRSEAGIDRRDGQSSWLELAALMTRARIFVGPDTSVTHLAAASNCPAVAIYGPTDPRLWGPWPASGLQAPWAAAEPIQRRGNVWLVQNPLPCLPCQREGCERDLASHSRCLDELPLERVLKAVDQALASSVH